MDEIREIVKEDNEDSKVIHTEHIKDGVVIRRDVVVIIKKMPELNGEIWLNNQSAI